MTEVQVTIALSPCTLQTLATENAQMVKILIGFVLKELVHEN